MDRQIYLASLRRNTAYPTFRGFIALVKWLTYILGGVCVAVGIMAGPFGMVGGIVAGLVLLVMGRIGAEVSLMMADMADASIDTAAARHGQR
ncbi:hypothetical protein CDN99_03325 [Roseateles aquatilis]|uniref:DUF4282 domain-containing protein n=1 Tax=Roseateles aquatilis TaxID=431061 RepID=A0A246JLN0_9BURK|nr:hypothetical protein [Roseateles aquatilis]OWQ93512.1 hypothetical protein CDN99_03325 [Roseateles aquatilis]